MTSLCDNSAVGTLIIEPRPVTGRRAANLRYLVCTSNTFPARGALPATHLGGYRSAGDAALSAVKPTGLQATLPQRLARGWRDNRCRRPPGQRAGHQWRIWQVAGHGDIDPGWSAECGAEWYDSSGLQRMAQQTAAYADGRISRDQFAAHPGIDPAWVYWLQRLRLIEVGPADLALCAALARDELSVQGWLTPADLA